jgi:uncharacterized protein YndB with AHSA1/START domain
MNAVARTLCCAMIGACLNATAGDSTMHIEPIDSSLFEAVTPARAFTVAETIAAPRAAVWDAWTRAEAFKAAYAPDSEALVAHIDLAVGGRYEWLFDGKTGSNGCQVLSFVPDRMLSFSWSAPPSIPTTRGRHTWVVVELDDAGDGTAVTLTHAGFGSGEDWDRTEAYFRKAWPYVLGQFKTHLEAAAAAQ